MFLFLLGQRVVGKDISNYVVRVVSDRRSDLIAFGHRSRVMLVDEFLDDDLGKDFRNANKVKLTEITHDTVRIEVQMGSDDRNTRAKVQAGGRCRSQSIISVLPGIENAVLPLRRTGRG